jgi:DNA-binding transcriptional MerR regulator
MTEFTETTSALAREAGTTAATIRKYADANLLQYVTASNGTRLFKAGQADRVRQIYARRMANRGRHPATD